jgi:hypothetical protein
LNFSLSKASACFLISDALNCIDSNFSIARFNDSTVCSSKNVPVFPSITVSKAPHFQYAITGVQLAIASNGTIQKSSSGGNIKAFAFA